MLEYIEFTQRAFLLVILGLPRIAMATIFIPFLNKQSLTGVIVRNGVLMSFVIAILPWLSFINLDDLTFVQFCGIILKELLLGATIGLILAIPFWAIEGIGFFIDNQRGSTMASTLNPLTGSQTSVLGILMGQVAIVYFLSMNGFTVLLEFLYKTYRIWPIDTYFPIFSLDKSIYYVQQMDRLMMLVVVLASPALIAMFLSEFCFALVNRSAQQLNVFILSMPVKSAVAMFIMVIYIERMFVYLGLHDSSPELLMKILVKLIQN